MTSVGTIKGLRARSLRDGDFDDPRTVDLEYDVRQRYDGEYWLYILNGPTGYESMPFNNIPEAIVREVPWAANFGNFTYDKLDVPWTELQVLWDRYPEIHNSRLCFKHKRELCACRPSRCCSTYTHGCSEVEHAGFDPDGA